MQETADRHKWQEKAARMNNHPAPTEAQLRDWAWAQQVRQELSEFEAAISDIQAALNTPGGGALSTPASLRGVTEMRLKTSSRRQGECVRVGNTEEYVQVGHLLRMAANPDNKGDERNMLERFVRSSFHRKPIIKDIDAFNSDTDLRTGNTVLSFFRDCDAGAGGLVFYIGQIRQIVASVNDNPKGVRQVFVSVDCNVLLFTLGTSGP